MPATKELPEQQEHPADDLVVDAIKTYEEDGFLINQETGEVIALADRLSEDRDKAAESILRRILRTDSIRASAVRECQAAERHLLEMQEFALARLKATPEYEEAAAIKENAMAIALRCDKKRNWLTAAFDEVLRNFALAHVSGKERSVRTPFGTVSLRKVAASIEVVDEGKAIDWAERNGALDAIKRSFLKSKIPNELRDKVLTGQHDPEIAGLEVKAAHDKLTVDSGVPS